MPHFSFSKLPTSAVIWFPSTPACWLQGLADPQIHMPIPFTTVTGSRKGQWPKTNKRDSGWYFLPQLLTKRCSVSLQLASCWWKPGISRSHHVEKVSYRMNPLREQKDWEMERKRQFSLNEFFWAPNSAVPEGPSIPDFLLQESLSPFADLNWSQKDLGSIQIATIFACLPCTRHCEVAIYLHSDLKGRNYWCLSLEMRKLRLKEIGNAQGGS